MDTPENLQNLLKAAAPLAPILTAVVQAVKPALPFEKKYMPTFSIVLGAVAGLLVVELSVTGGLVGVTLGLAATGVYEFGKNSGFGTNK